MKSGEIRLVKTAIGGIHVIFEVLKVIWLLLPAYTPNNFAVILGGIKPMDFGKNFIDGKRIFGDGKTFSGFLGGILGGILVANVQRLIENAIEFRYFSALGYRDFIILVTALSCGAMFGDLLGSFIKRRLNFERGRSFPVVDQLTFLLFSLAFASLTNAFWFLFTSLDILIGILITPVLHVLVNFLAFKLNLKEVPW